MRTLLEQQLGSPDLRSAEAREIDDQIASRRAQKRAAMEAQYLATIGARALNADEVDLFADGLGLTGADFSNHRAALLEAAKYQKALEQVPDEAAIARLHGEAKAAATAAHERAVQEVASIFRRATTQQIMDALPRIYATCVWLQNAAYVPDGLEPLREVLGRAADAESAAETAQNAERRILGYMADLKKRYPVLFPNH